MNITKKQLILGILVSLPSLSGCGQNQNSLPQWKMTVHVQDEAGLPVPNADVKIAYYIEPPPNESIALAKKTGKTDTNGAFVATGRSDYMLECSARKDGYYLALSSYVLGMAYQFDSLKWSPTQTLLLKRMGNPIPMYAKATRSNVSEADIPFCYDLMVGDWTAPRGGGKNTDVIFKAHMDKRAENDFDYELVVSFPNPGDGIQPFKISDLEGTSRLRSPHEAPESGYQAKWVKTQKRRPNEPSVYPLDDKLNFFFRVRTVLDEKGRVKSALYGKIYGDFMNFRYYLNPEPNSRNMEFDPGKNLIKKLGPSEHVNDP